MKKTYFIFILFFISTTLSFSQPTLTIADWPILGEQFTSHNVDTTGIDPGGIGPNQNWDFSHAIDIGSGTIFKMIDPLGTFFIGPFTSTNAFSSNITIGASYKSRYEKYNADTSAIDLLDYFTDCCLTFFDGSDPLRKFVFPLSYGTNFTDTYLFHEQHYVHNWYVTSRRGSSLVTCDAYGTLTTPFSTYQDVLRIRTEEHSTDTIFIDGMYGYTTNQTITRFEWIGLNHLQPIFDITYLTIVSSQSDTTYFKYVNYSTVTTGIQEISIKPLEVYPNPLINASHLHLKLGDMKGGKATFIATDIIGKEVKNIVLSPNQMSNEILDIDMSDCPNGIYLIQLQQGDAIYSTKFVKN